MGASSIKTFSSLGILDPRDFGTLGDGSADASVGINAALLAVSKGGMVRLAPGHWRCDNPVTIPDGKALVGSHRAGLSLGPQGKVTDPTKGGCVLGCNWAGAGTSAASTPFITPGNFSVLDGFSIYDQLLGATGTTARPSMVGTAYNTANTSTYIGTATPIVRNLALMNCDKGIRMWGVVRFQIKECFISALTNAIAVDQMWDTSRIKSVSVAPYAYLSPAGIPAAVNSDIQTNLIAYRFGHCDSLLVADCMVYLAQTGVLLEPSPYATTPRDPWIRLSDCDLDVCDSCVDSQAEAAQAVQFSGGSWTTFAAGASPNGIGLRVGATAGEIGLSNASIESQARQEVRQGGGTLQLLGCRLDSYGNTGPANSPSIVTTAGNLVVSGSVFSDPRSPLQWTSSGHGVFANNLNLGGVAVSGNSTLIQTGNN